MQFHIFKDQNQLNMKKVLSIFIVVGVFIACSTEEQRSDEDLQGNTHPVKNDADASEKDSLKNIKAIDSKEAMIKTALQAVPEKRRENCTVKGYDESGALVVLQQGNNPWICLADHPQKDGFSAACYHKSLEPFMARGRALKKAGKDGREIFNIRKKEIKSGKLEMCEPGAALHVYYGPKAVYEPKTGEVLDAQHRFVVYMPFATAASTGLPESPQKPNHPWIMDPGTHKAHIMITPKAE